MEYHEELKYWRSHGFGGNDKMNRLVKKMWTSKLKKTGSECNLFIAIENYVSFLELPEDENKYDRGPLFSLQISGLSFNEEHG